MRATQHSVLREGTITGLLGALLVALWYFVFDTAAGHPFRTPNVLGKILFRGDVTPGVRSIVPQIVAGFTVLHFVLYVLTGMALTFLIHLATRNPALRMGVWLGAVIAFGYFAGLTYMLYTATGERVPLWTVVGGTALGVVSMAAYLWRRHPRLEQTFHEAPLGSEVPPPPHPPGTPMR
jgi:hypothetical protein